MSVYLDHNATSAMLPEVLDAMLPWFRRPANPASIHSYGQRAAMAVDVAREQVARLVGGASEGVVFTSGATEANHLYIRMCPGVDTVCISAVEHPSVVNAARAKAAGQLIIAPVNEQGIVAPGHELHADLVSLIWANHEVGVVQPIRQLREYSRARRFHTDATQAAGRVHIDMAGLDAVSLSSHKLGGPGSMGALVLAHGRAFPALLGGGAQQRGRRAGTVNTAAVVGFGVACDLARARLDQRRTSWRVLGRQLRHQLEALGAQVITSSGEQLLNTVAFTVNDWRGETIVQALDMAGVAVSAGAACASGSVDPSPTLLAMGHADPLGLVRVSMGASTSAEDLSLLVAALAALLQRA